MDMVCTDSGNAIAESTSIDYELLSISFIAQVNLGPLFVGAVTALEYDGLSYDCLTLGYVARQAFLREQERSGQKLDGIQAQEATYNAHAMVYWIVMSSSRALLAVVSSSISIMQNVNQSHLRYIRHLFAVA